MAPNNQTLGNNELGAWRIFSLFMLLIQKGPLPSAEIYAAIYSDLSTDSALRTFSRDRTVLKRSCPEKWCKQAFQVFKRSAVIS